ncbi:MAG: UvrD-helicase domain-containing protein [Bacteroidales bacterium]|jgi:ATP-dependent exoDNAse (exonuclease V) beta subunit|nr:UvrD-helicase domain-containing protein [Bacteroidales bacterium]
MSLKNFKIYKSSAGSGKTFTLVSEFLRLIILNPTNYKNILAITFTNKAANEMKMRIVSSLVQLSSDPGLWPSTLEKMIEPLIAVHELDKETIRQRAVIVTASILHNYSDLAVATIDSFMQKVIRTFSLDLNLPQNYEVELDTDTLRQRAVDRLIDQAGSDKELTKLMVNFIESKTEDDKSWRIENDFNEIAKNLFREDSIIHRHDLKNLELVDYQAYYVKLRKWNSEFENNVVGIADKVFELIENNWLEVDDFHYGKTGALGFFIKLRKNIFKDLNKPGVRIQEAVKTGQWAKKDRPQQIQEKIHAIAPEFTQLYVQTQQLAGEPFQRYNLFRLLHRNMYPLAVLGSIDKIISEINEEEHTLPITDFNPLILSVTQTETIPYIYERLGSKYHHLMIDEFQDTSIMQWRNLLPLVDNALSENYLNLVVGDAKQAIYRWRNGEVDQFIELPKLPGTLNDVNQEREENLIRHHEIRELPVNWRSHKGIVEFNNVFFKHISKYLSQEYQPVYGDIDQKFNPVKDKGFVQIEFFSLESKEDKSMLERIPVLINKILDLNYKQGDIAILCRKNEQGSEIARYLLDQGINVISAESLLLGNSENVKLVMCLMKIIADANDQLAYAEALIILSQKGTFGNLTINESGRKVLTKTTNSRNMTFDIDAFEELLQEYGISFSRSALLDMTLYDLADEIIRLLHLSYHDDIYLQFFLNELHGSIKQKSLTLRELSDWWEEKGRKVSVIFPENLDAVKIMTIHKAKGLEFPVVIYPYAEGKVKPTIKNIWLNINEPVIEKMKKALLPVDRLNDTMFEEIKIKEYEKSLLDTVNLLYVAFTRAEERLYVLTKKTEKKNDKVKTVEAMINDFTYSSDTEWYNSGESIWRFQQSVDHSSSRPATDATDAFFRIDSEYANSRRHQYLLRSSRDAFKWKEEDKAVDFGISVHALLARIRTGSDLEQAIQTSFIAGELTTENKTRYEKTLRNIINHKALELFFSNQYQVKSEPEILLPGGEILRPDRIVISDTEILVAEFKTGQPKQSHTSQLINYMELLRTITQSKIKGFLVYANEEECIVKEV